MMFAVLPVFLYFMMDVHIAEATCGCKSPRPCYQYMVDALSTKNEANCVEDADIGGSTIMVFIKALETFCGEVVNVSESWTNDSSRLFEVVIYGGEDDDEVPVIIVEAGQTGGKEPADLSLFIMEQLIACIENNDMIQKARWVILPHTNPDGWAYSDYKKFWKKNTKLHKNKISFGVDISKNFDSHWNECPRTESKFSQDYAGASANSEMETVFICKVIKKYKKHAKAYISIRRDGHGIYYPYSHKNARPSDGSNLAWVASEVAARVNQRAGGVHTFFNDTIYALNGKPLCGSSVDYAYEAGIPLSYEMRVFFDIDSKFARSFQSMPINYENSVRRAYLNGIKQLCVMLTNKQKYDLNFKRYV